MTYSNLLSVITGELCEAEISSPGVEGRALICAAAGISYGDWFTVASRDVPPDCCEKALSLAKERINGCPAAYLCGTWEFYGLEFFVSPKVLIPRSDTELMVDVSLRRNKCPKKVLDLCTGSGCVGITLAKLSGAEVILSDFSPEALDICKKNAAAHLPGNRFQTELRDARLRRSEKNCFDLIVSNPPYVTEEEYGQLEPEVKNFEPKMALVGNCNGMEFYESIPAAVYDALIPGGVLVFECGCFQAEAVGKCLASAGYTHIEFDKDTAGILRNVSAEKPF